MDSSSIYRQFAHTQVARSVLRGIALDVDQLRLAPYLAALASDVLFKGDHTIFLGRTRKGKKWEIVLKPRRSAEAFSSDPSENVKTLIDNPIPSKP